jgi:ubiquinone/menaquinone biosynthesis C-methylase UbiE
VSQFPVSEDIGKNEASVYNQNMNFEHKKESSIKKQESENVESGMKQDIELATRAGEGKARALEELYQGFFGSEENCEIFARHIPNEIYDRENATIVDAGSSQGTLGNYVREKFRKNGSDARLVMIDTNAVAMKQSSVQAEKIEASLMETPLASETADLVILRSVLQYVEPKYQAKILEEIKRILKPGGILVSQFCSYDTQEQANCFNGLFDVAKRRVNFCGKEEGIDLHRKIFDKIEEIADGPTLYETFDEFFVRRINAPEEQMKEAKEYIRQNIEGLQGVLTHHEEPYAWQIPYTIVTCKKTKNIIEK